MRFVSTYGDFRCSRARFRQRSILMNAQVDVSITSIAAHVAAIAAATILCLLPALAFADGDSSTTVATRRMGVAGGPYPPYPDIWIWAPQRPPASWKSDIALRILAGGDVLVSFLDWTSTNASRTEISTFFGQRSFPSAEAALGGRSTPREDRPRISLGDDRLVTGHLNGFESCGRGVGDFIRIEDKTGKEIASRTILVLLDRERISRTLSCDGRNAQGFPYRVAPIFGRLLALKDGTFLVTDTTSGLVMRFTEIFGTNSESLGKRFFVVDKEFLAQTTQKHSVGPGGQIDWRAVQRELITWAKANSKGRQP